MQLYTILSNAAQQEGFCMLRVDYTKSLDMQIDRAESRRKAAHRQDLYCLHAALHHIVRCSAAGRLLHAAQHTESLDAV